MAEIVLRDIEKYFGDNYVIRKLNLTIAHKEFVVLLGPSGCGKTTTLRAIAGLEEIDTRRHPDRRQAGAESAGRRPRHRLRLPALRALSAPHRLRQHRLSAARHAREPRRGRPEGARTSRKSLQIEHLLQQAAVAAFRRRHAARRHRPRAGAASEGDADGRADRRARRQAARGDAHRAEAAASGERPDHRLRHARPGRGDVARRPHRHHERGRAAAGRHARPTSISIRPTSSSRSSSAAR